MDEMPAITPSMIRTWTDWQKSITEACESANPECKIDISLIQHDKRETTGIWIQAMHLYCTNGDDGLYDISITVMMDTGRSVPTTRKAATNISRDEIPGWFLQFMDKVCMCRDCGDLSISTSLCPPCAFEYMRFEHTSETDSHRCSLCHEVCYNQLVCEHSVHNHCFRRMCRNEPHPRCPLCRAPVTDSDVLKHVPV